MSKPEQPTAPICPTCGSDKRIVLNMMPHPTEDARCFDPWHAGVAGEVAPPKMPRHVTETALDFEGEIAYMDKIEKRAAASEAGSAATEDDDIIPMHGSGDAFVEEKLNWLLHELRRNVGHAEWDMEECANLLRRFVKAEAYAADLQAKLDAAKEENQKLREKLAPDVLDSL